MRPASRAKAQAILAWIVLMMAAMGSCVLLEQGGFEHPPAVEEVR